MSETATAAFRERYKRMPTKQELDYIAERGFAAFSDHPWMPSDDELAKQHAEAYAAWALAEGVLHRPDGSIAVHMCPGAYREMTGIEFPFRCGGTE